MALPVAPRVPAKGNPLGTPNPPPGAPPVGSPPPGAPPTSGPYTGPPPPGAPPTSAPASGPASKPLRSMFNLPQSPGYGIGPGSKYPALSPTYWSDRLKAKPPAQPTPGTESGPTYAEDRYTSRANGTDPGWEYATGRAQDQINRQYAARGGYNSSGAMNSIGDMYANATSQREGQLDTLAENATNAHQNALNGMFTAGLGIDNGQSSAGQPYGMAGGQAQTDAMRAQVELLLSRAGIDQKTRQGELDAIFKGGQGIATAVA